MTAFLNNPKVLTAYAIFQVLALIWTCVALRTWDKNAYKPPALVLEYFPGWDMAGLNTKYYLSGPSRRDYWRSAFLALTPGVNILTIGTMMPIYAVVELKAQIKKAAFRRKMREAERIWGG